jgi:hypothetical protein
MTETTWKRSPVVWLSLGLILGVSLSYLMPFAPAHAAATDRYENFAICTGPVSDDLEGVFVLDSVAGQLQAFILDPQTGQFSLRYARMIGQDMGVANAANGRYVMVTGFANISPRATGGQRSSQCVLYVAELSSGNLGAYTLPFAGRSGAGVAAVDFLPLHRIQFRQVGVRPGAPPPAPE